jgi:hypothetical protein
MSVTLIDKRELEYKNMTRVHEEEWPLETAPLERLAIRHEPTVFRGLVRSWLPWEAGEGGSALDWLNSKIGHRVVPVSVGLPGDTGYVGGSLGRASTATTLDGRRAFRDLAREMARELDHPTGHRLYIQSLRIDSFAPELNGLLKLPAAQLPTGGHWRAWIGTGDHHGYLHVDGTENLFCVLAGTKTFLLCPFDVLPDIYVGPLEGGPYKSPASIVDPWGPELKQFPRMSHGLEQAVTVTLQAGDAMYLPSEWWHSVQSYGFNFSMNYWWYDIVEKARTEAELAFCQALLSIRSLPGHWREFWKVLYENFVFLSHGEPYSHLPAEEQGFAGKPTPERIAFLRARIAEAGNDGRKRATSAESH